MNYKFDIQGIKIINPLMKKIPKRRDNMPRKLLSVLLAVCMIAGMLPTFATAAVGDSYTYHFNPTEEDTSTAYNATSHSYETTVKNTAEESVYAPWAYVKKYNTTGGYPKPDKLKVPAMEVRGKENWWLALKIQVPESGVYDAKLLYTTYKANGGINIYLLPGTAELPAGACDFSESYADYQLNTDVVSLYASSAKGNQSAEITTKKDITASKDGAEFYLVFQAVKSSKEYGSSSDAYYAFLESLTLTKTAEVGIGTQYTVTYDANGGSVEIPSEMVGEGNSAILPAPVRDGYDFYGWSDEKETYAAGESYIVKNDVTLTALWTKKSEVSPNYTLVYNFNPEKTNGVSLKNITYDTSYGMWKWSDQTTSGIKAVTDSDIGTGIEAVLKYSENEWLALEIYIPAAGTYKSSLGYGKSNSGGGYSDVYLFKPGTEVSSQSFTAENKLNALGEISYYNRPSSLKEESEVINNAFEIEEAGKYILVFKPTRNGNGKDEVPGMNEETGKNDDACNMYIHSLTLEAGADDAVMYVEPSTSELELNINEFKNISADVYLSDGIIADTDEYGLTYEAVNDNGVIEVNSEKGMITGLKKGRARVRIIAARTNPSGATSSESAFVNVEVKDPTDKIVLDEVTLEVKDGFAGVTGAKMSDGSDADLSEAQISYSVKELDKAGIDEKTGEIFAQAEVEVTVFATVTLGGVSKTVEVSGVQVEPAVPDGKTISGENAEYNFGGIESSWNDLHSNKNLIDIRYITDEYTSGNWEWGYTNAKAITGIAPTKTDATPALVYKNKKNAVRFNVATGEWLALRVDIPADGIYRATLSTYKDTSGNGAFDVWVVPEADADGDTDIDNDDVEMLISENTKAGSVDPQDFASSKFTDTFLSKPDLKKGKNLVVFKTTSGSFIWPTVLKIEGSNELKTLNLNLSKTGYTKEDLDVPEEVSWEVRRRDGSIIDKSELDWVRYESDDENVVTFKNGVLTPVTGGTATITMSVTEGDITLETSRLVVVNAPRTGELIIIPDDSRPFTNEVVKLSARVNFDKGGTEPLPDSVVDYEICGSDGEILRGGYVTVPRQTENDITVSVRARTFLDGEEWTSQPTDIVFHRATKKDESTYYTTDRVEAARSNIKKYEWAKDTLESAEENAERYLSGFDAIYNAIIGEGVPRSNRVGDFRDEEYMYCRYCGHNIGAEYGSTTAYLINVFSRPWKVQCPECKRMFPSNDFEGLLKLGLQADGTFDRMMALEKHRRMLLDKGIALSNTEPGEEGSDTWYTYYGYGVEGGYLYNDLYSELRSGEKADIDPRTGDKVDGCRWGVDDGLGYLPGRVASGAQERHTYVAYYMHSAFIEVDNAVEYMTKAYVYSGKQEYGTAAAILLNRLADVYPSFDFIRYFNENYQFSLSHGGSGRGKIYGRINDCDYVANWICCADGLYELITDETKNAGIIEQISERDRKYAEEYSFDYDESDKLTGEAVWSNIENGIIREAYVAAKDGRVGGNYGQVQKTIAAAALVLDTEPESKDMMKWVYRKGVTTIEDGKRNVAGGALSTQILHVVDRDGHGNEAAPNYNYSWLIRMNELANILAMYDSGNKKFNLFADPNFAKMYTAQRLLTLTESHSAQIGDSGYTADNRIFGEIPTILNGFKHIKEIEGADRIANELAEYIWNRNGHSAEGLHYDIFSKNPEEAERDILEYIDDGLTVEKSGMLPAYGFAILADGAANGDKNLPTYSNTMRDFWLYFGRAAGHGHLDSLNLGIEAFGLNMAPDNGTPASKSINMVRYQWVESSIAHNTVTVGNTVQNVFGTSTLGQRAYYLGYPKHFDSSDGVVKLMDVESDAYKDIADIYRRTVVMINVGSDVSYGIDFFRVKGGGEHIYSFHSQSHEVETEGLKLDPQDETQGDYKLDDKGYVGSYAGADVPYMYDQNRQTAIQKLKYPGTSWLKDVRRAAASRNEIAGDKFTVDFKVTDYNRFLKDSDGLHLRMTMLNDDYDEVAVATGTKVDTPSAQKLKPFEYVLVKNKDDSLFTTVFEPYKNKRYLESINEVDISATADEGKLGSDDIARAVKVTRTDGRTDYVVYATNSDVTYTVADGDFSFEFRGFVGVLSLEKEGGEVIYRYVNDGDILHTSVDENDSDGKYDYGAYTGVVASYTEVEPAVKPTFNKNFITIETRDTVDTDRIIGQYVYIDNEGRADSQQNAVYKIENATYDASGKKLTIDIGTVSTVRTFEDIYNIDAGYIYNIAKGQNAVIPLSNIENCGPEFAKVSDFSVSAGSSVSVSLAQYRTDDNGKSVTYEAVGGVDIPRGASIDSATGKLTWRPDDSQVGNHSFKIKMRDELGRETAVTFVVTVYGRTTEGSSSGETPEIPSAGASGGGVAPTDKPDDTTNTDEDESLLHEEKVPGADEADEVEKLRFTDLSNHAWAADAINTLAADGIIKGTSANTFSPAANISRADFALLLVRAFKLSSDNTENFADVSASDYFAAELAIARNTGIVNGIGDNKFASRNHITRQDMMVIVYRALQSQSLPLEGSEAQPNVGTAMNDSPVDYQNRDVTEPGEMGTVEDGGGIYPDFTTVADYAKEAVSALIGAGLVNGKSGRIAPTDYTTRAEVAVLIKRILDYTKN